MTKSLMARFFLYFMMFNLLAVESFLPVQILKFQFGNVNTAYASGSGSGTTTPPDSSGQRYVDCEEKDGLRRGECKQGTYKPDETNLWEDGEPYFRQIMLWVTVLVAVMHIKKCISPATSCGWADAPAAIGALALIGAEIANFWTYKEKATEIKYNQDQLAKHSQECKDGTLGGETDKTGRIGGYNICDQMAALQAEKESLEAMKTAADWKFYLQLVAAIAFTLAAIIEYISAIARAVECRTGGATLTAAAAAASAASATPATAAICSGPAATLATATATWEATCATWTNPAPVSPSMTQSAQAEASLSALQAAVTTANACAAAAPAVAAVLAAIARFFAAVSCLAGFTACEAGRGTGTVAAFYTPIDGEFKRKYAHYYLSPVKWEPLNQRHSSVVSDNFLDTYYQNRIVIEDSLNNSNFDFYKNLQEEITKNPYIDLITKTNRPIKGQYLLELEDIALPDNFYSYVHTAEYNRLKDGHLSTGTSLKGYYHLKAIDQKSLPGMVEDKLIRLLANAVAGDTEIKKTSDGGIIHGLIGNGLGLVLGPVAIGIIVAAFPGIVSVEDGLYATPLKRALWQTGLAALVWVVAFTLTNPAREKLGNNIKKLEDILNRANTVTSGTQGLNQGTTDIGVNPNQENKLPETVNLPPNAEINCPTCNGLGAKTDFAMRGVGLTGMSGLSSSLSKVSKGLTNKGSIPGNTLDEARKLSGKAGAVRKKLKDMKNLLTKTLAQQGIPLNVDKTVKDMGRKMSGIVQRAMASKGVATSDIFGSKTDPIEQMKEQLTKDPFVDALANKAAPGTAAAPDTSGTGFDFNLQENKDPSLELDDMGENAISDLNIPVDDISDNPSGNIFQLLTTRYMKTAYPILFEETPPQGTTPEE